MYIYDSNTKKHYDVHGTENQSSPPEVVDYFKKSYTEFYDKEYEKKKINMMVNLFDSLNKKIYWMFHDVIPIELVDNKNVIYFPILEENTKTEYRIPGVSHFNDCLTYFTEHFGLILSEETKGEYKDNHYSIKGHQIIAEKVIEKINE
jgi:hypothetical protein